MKLKIVLLLMAAVAINANAQTSVVAQITRTNAALYMPSSSSVDFGNHGVLKVESRTLTVTFSVETNRTYTMLYSFDLKRWHELTNFTTNQETKIVQPFHPFIVQRVSEQMFFEMAQSAAIPVPIPGTPVVPGGGSVVVNNGLPPLNTNGGGGYDFSGGNPTGGSGGVTSTNGTLIPNPNGGGGYITVGFSGGNPNLPPSSGGTGGGYSGGVTEVFGSTYSGGVGGPNPP